MRHDERKPSRAGVWAQALSVAAAVAPFGLTFGVAASTAGLSLWQACGFSLLVFAGSAQFAAVGVLGAGGSALAAIGTGLLLNLRFVALGTTVSPHLPRRRWARALAAQWLVDESAAVALAQPDAGAARFGFLATGGAIYLGWNIATVVGHQLAAASGQVISSLGLDAAAEAAFVGLLWPRLADVGQRRVAGLGALVAVALVPVAPAGLAVLAAATAVIADRGLRHPGPQRAEGEAGR
jgi:predicted branched-subunit amino acid permease